MKLSFLSSVFQILILLIILLSNIILPDVRHVSRTNSSQFQYTSWETSSGRIQNSMDICDKRDTVYVGNGVYKETRIKNKNIV